MVSTCPLISKFVSPYIYFLVTAPSTLCEFFTPALADCHSREYRQVSRTLLSILVDLSNFVVLTISARFPISNTMFLIKLLGVAPSAPATIGITVTFIFQRFFSSLSRYKYLSLFLFSLIFTQWSAGKAKSNIRYVHFNSLTLLFLASGQHWRQVVVIHWSLSGSKSPPISRTLLSILADLMSIVVWMASILSLITNSSSLFSSPWSLFQLNQLQLVSPSPSCSIIFSAPWQDSTCRFLLFSLSGPLEQQNQLSNKLISIRPSGWD